MKKIILLFLLSLFFCTNVYAIDEPEIGAAGGILMDSRTGRVLYGKNIDEQLSMASTTKIMTAIITLENADLEETVKVSGRASKAPEVKLFLKADEEVRLGDLMQALMLESSNDAAVAIAEHVGGTVEGFADMMNKKAKELGANNTGFVTPNGLDAEGHYSTAFDMALITKYALENDQFVEIINTPSHSFTTSRTSYSVNNKNRLLQEYEGAIGVKSGFTGLAGQCFVGAAERNDMKLISVVLASGWGSAGKEQKWIDTKRLLDYGFDNYKYIEICKPEEEIGKLKVTTSKILEVDLKTEEVLILPLNAEEEGEIKIVDDFTQVLDAPVEENKVVGLRKVYIGEAIVKEIPIITASAAPRHDFKICLEKLINVWFNLSTNGKIDVRLK